MAAPSSQIVCSQCQQKKTARTVCEKCKVDAQFQVFRSELTISGTGSFPVSLLASLGLMPKTDTDAMKLRTVDGPPRSIRFERFSKNGSRVVAKPFADAGWRVVADTGRFN